MGISNTPGTVLGGWRIIEMDLWDGEAVDLMGSALIEFGQDQANLRLDQMSEHELKEAIRALASDLRPAERTACRRRRAHVWPAHWRHRCLASGPRRPHESIGWS